MSAPRKLTQAEKDARVVPAVRLSCEKCRGSDIRIRWHQGRYRTAHDNRCSYGNVAQTEGEHLHYICQTCLYDWTGPIASKPRAKRAPKPGIEGGGSGVGSDGEQ